jgi:hypothetical protein
MSNANNPFGDEKLLDTFVWGKKLEKKGLTDVPPERLKVMTAQRVEENKVSLVYSSLSRIVENEMKSVD